MGLFSAILIAIGGICFVLLLFQALIILRNGPGKTYIFGAVMSLVFFLYILVTLNALSHKVPEESFLPGLKLQLVLAQAVMVSFIGLTHLIVREKSRMIFTFGLVLLTILSLITIFLPEDILFGQNTGLYLMVLATGERFLMIAPGITMWRFLIDVSLIIMLSLSGMLVWRRYARYGPRCVPALLSGSLIVAICASVDQLIDLGSVQFYYILPYGLFINYLILTLIPFDNLLKDIFQTNEAIHRERKWRTLVNQANVIVVELNRMGHVESINPYFLKLTGYRESEVLGKDWFEFFVPSDQYFDVQSAFIEILEFDFHPHYRNPILTKYQGKRLIDWYNVRLRDVNDQVTGSISFGFDITDESDEVDELRKKLDESEVLLKRLKSEGKI